VAFSSIPTISEQIDSSKGSQSIAPCRQVFRHCRLCILCSRPRAGHRVPLQLLVAMFLLRLQCIQIAEWLSQLRYLTHKLSKIRKFAR
jgi:hypothetical protein